MEIPLHAEPVISKQYFFLFQLPIYIFYKFSSVNKKNSYDQLKSFQKLLKNNMVSAKNSFLVANRKLLFSFQNRYNGLWMVSSLIFLIFNKWTSSKHLRITIGQYCTPTQGSYLYNLGNTLYRYQVKYLNYRVTGLKSECNHKLVYIQSDLPN